ncbi:hypothetical protein UZ36_07040 [Candidatus Nitromaritima sp. SCGC AAA799-C22]|nr:hypothetical protein UZ36_07040 [Candidatus Nitromaritima sp. SCGC AAA799-C22]
MCNLMKEMNANHNTVTIGQMTLKCRYHKNEQEQFTENTFLKSFKCMELFHSLYPMVLALMYDAKFEDDELELTCPNAENTVKVRLFLEPVGGLLALVNAVKEVLRPLRPMDVVHSVVCVEVLDVKGSCYVECKVGDIYRVDLTGSMCPQALYSVFPALMHSDGCNNCTCPSNVNQIVFESSAN